MGQSATVAGLPPIEVSVLEPADWDAVGDLYLLVEILRRIEQSRPDLTLTASLVYLKPALAASSALRGRRACLVAVFVSPDGAPRVLLDVDHSNLPGGLSGLMLRYDQPCALSDMERHVKQLLDGMVDHYGHWDKEAERALPHWVTVKRLPKLLRMTERRGDGKYVERWSRRLKRMMWR